ncbi:MAG: hypothetical protein JWP38_555 [Herbaspirillum sp.]|jgi:protein CpxP|nr:hypothetical protein [Herbaspirillum sp.]
MLNLKKQCMVGLMAFSMGLMSLAAHADTSAQSPGGQHGPSPEKTAKFHQKMLKRQEALHARLKLTAEQEPAWKTFVDQTRPPEHRQGMQGRDRAAMAKLTAPERMEKFLAGMQAREASLTQRLNAVKTFYAVLTPVQQKVFDAAFAHVRFGEHGEHGHRGHHGDRGEHHQRDAAPAPAAQ